MTDQDDEQPVPAAGPASEPEEKKHGSEKLKYEDDGRSDEGDGFSEREREQHRENLNRLHGDRDHIGTNFSMPGPGARVYSADNITFFGAGPEERPQTILLSPEELDRLVYVATCDTLHALDAALVPGAVLGTFGPSGTGRRTVALAGLARFALRQAGGAKVAHLMAADNPRRLRADDLTPGTAYLLDAGAAEWTRTHNEAVFRHLVWLAEQTKAAMVVVLNERSVLSSEQRARYIHAHVAPPAFDVFERCLAYGLRKVPADLAQVAYGLAADPRVREELATAARPGDGAALAHALVRRLRDGGDPAEVLDEVLNLQPQRLREQAAELLGGTMAEKESEPAHQHRRTVYQRSFLLSLAVLDGRPQTVVDAVAVRLAEKIGVPEPERLPEGDLWSAFDQSAPDWLKYARAEIVYGSGPWDRLVRFRDARLGPKILESAWLDHPVLRGPFLDLLEGLCEDADFDVRMASAQAVGKLATYDFAAVDDRFLGPWVRSDRVRTHWAAAWALESAAFEPFFTEEVRRRLLRWTRESLGRRSVAVRAFGSTLGLWYIDDALLGLRRIAASSRGNCPGPSSSRCTNCSWPVRMSGS
ncbi:hypothetical protein [Herbidospora sp. NBRC 101105]|uniref:hypothetical protein n=1 Tax=Herbidospora sp. NBRC 101105 TaxID=3032195 RepID=UPI0024A591E8|nr:hypothetical protein [Herbidospora sp. NBRC 101105]GLX93934.1 hypothetical protein Hesp01_18840 [Herbidospora sp. NBRC 101105]